MIWKIRPAMAVLAATSLGACHLPAFGGDKAPTGEVVAVVDGQEITARQLRTELGASVPSDPRALKKFEQQALQEIIARKLVAAAARQEGVDKTPDFVIQQQRETETLLSQKLIEKITTGVPATSREEAESYISAHPDIFAERKIFNIDQVRIIHPTNPEIMDGLKPIDTMDSVIEFLNNKQVKYERGMTTLDAVGSDPNLIAAVMKLPANEVFVFPAGQFILINQIKSSRIEPFVGEAAVTYAMAILKKEHTQDAVQRELREILAKGGKDVRLNKAFKPSQTEATTKAPETR